MRPEAFNGNVYAALKTGHLLESYAALIKGRGRSEVTIVVGLLKNGEFFATSSRTGGYLTGPEQAMAESLGIIYVPGHPGYSDHGEMVAVQVGAIAIGASANICPGMCARNLSDLGFHFVPRAPR